MIIYRLAADSSAERIRIVSPAKDARLRKIARKKLAEPVNVVLGGPGSVSVAVQAMDCNDAA